jgi:hypothetical protein
LLLAVLRAVVELWLQAANNMRIGDLNILHSRIVCWSLFVMFSVLTAGWGFVSVAETKPLTDNELTVLRIIVVLFGLQAVWFFILAMRAGKSRKTTF